MERISYERPSGTEHQQSDEWKPDEVQEELCIQCGTTFERHPDDPPACSSRCWLAYLEGPR
jgi:hypothetical protein